MRRNLAPANPILCTLNPKPCEQAVYDDPKTRAAFNSDVRINLSAVRNWTSADYISAQVRHPGGLSG